MDLPQVIKLIAEYGISVVCSGLVLLFFYILMKKSIENQEKQQAIINQQQQEMNEQNHQLLQHIMESVPYSITPEKYNSSIMIDNEIDLVLHDILNTLECSRVCLVTFHNGRKRPFWFIFLKDECA